MVMTNAKTDKTITKIIISDNDMPEFIGQMIDIFEDFLDEKGVTIDNPERKEDDAEGANIYGSDYDELADSIRTTIESWAKAQPEAINDSGGDKLIVKTPGGVIQAYISSDPDYPGIWLTNTSAPGEPGAVLEYGPMHRDDMTPAMKMRIYEGWNQNSEPEVIRMGTADVICMGAAADEDNC